MVPQFINKALIPHKAGIYIYLDLDGQILYVGKAIDLYHRVSSYFNRTPDSSKTAALIERIANIETIIVESELEALVLEANLIKKYLPPYNIKLVDDKDFLYIKITKENFPQVLTARKKDLKNAWKYFGPFPSTRTVKDTLKKLRKIFPWCSNPPGIDHETDTLLLKRPCFYYHIKQCPGACVGKISSLEYKKNIKHLVKFLDGQKKELMEELHTEMKEYSKNLEFEKAFEIKKTIAGMEYLTQPNRVKNYLENPNFLKEENHVVLIELQKMLGLQEIPERIEGYDISNIGGKFATGSLVVLTHGEIDKSQYRKFKIRIAGRPNDYAMHAEMMKRRLNHPEWPLPRLFIIDGGRGQVRASVAELQKRGIEIPIYGLAKRMEWLYPPEGGVVKLPKRSLALRALQKLRDESHRFAITYHRKLRKKEFLGKHP